MHSFKTQHCNKQESLNKINEMKVTITEEDPNKKKNLVHVHAEISWWSEISALASKICVITFGLQHVIKFKKVYAVTHCSLY